MKNKFVKNKGILFWTTGISESGKTTIGKKLFQFVKKNFGPSILVSGDEIRNIFNLKNYDHNSRLKYLRYYSNFCKKIINQKINVIISVVGLSEKIRKKNRSKFNNYVEIFLKSDVNKIKKMIKKKFIITKLMCEV